MSQHEHLTIVISVSMLSEDYYVHVREGSIVDKYIDEDDVGDK